MWIFHYSPVALKGILPGPHYRHWLLIVKGLSLLLRPKVTDESIATAENLIQKFLLELEDLYGRGVMHYNIHQLMHLPMFVRARGPLYLYSMVPFESYNHHLQQLPTGSTNVLQQICKRFLIELVVKFGTEYSGIPGPRSWPAAGPEDKLLPMDKVQLKTLSSISRNVIATAMPAITDSQHVYKRLLVNNLLYHSIAYEKAKVTDSTCTLVAPKEVLTVHAFIQVSENSYAAVGESFSCVYFENLDYLMKVDGRPQAIAIPCNNLGPIVIKMVAGNDIFFSKFLNNYECNSE